MSEGSVLMQTTQIATLDRGGGELVPLPLHCAIIALRLNMIALRKAIYWYRKC